MGATINSLRIEVSAGADVDTDELAELCLGLRDELLELDIDTVDAIASIPPPRGAKGHSTESVGLMAVVLSNSAVVGGLAGVLRSWVGRRRGRTVKLQLGEDSIEITQASVDQQMMLIESWLDRHAGD